MRGRCWQPGLSERDWRIGEGGGEGGGTFTGCIFRGCWGGDFGLAFHQHADDEEVIRPCVGGCRGAHEPALPPRTLPAALGKLCLQKLCTGQEQPRTLVFVPVDYGAGQRET